VVVCLVVIGLAVTVLLRGYRDRLTMERLDLMARPIYVQVRSLILGQVTADKLWTSLLEQAEKNEVYIILSDNAGDIIKQVTPTPTSSPQLINVPLGSLPHGMLRATQGKFETSDGRTFIFAAYPFGKLVTTLEMRVDTLVLSTPQAGSMAIWATMLRPFLLAGVIALIVSLVVAILLARSVYRPLSQVTAAARKIAQGDYNQRVPEAGSREVRELATNFNNMTEQVKQSQQQLRHFVADVSHELKSPLTSIQGFAQALVDGTANDSGTRLQAANIINDEAKRMRRQVDELLELSRMQSGQFRMKREPLDVGEVLQQCAEVFEPQARGKRVKIRLQTVPSVTVSGDADRLEQLFSNLLDNAIKHTPAGEDVSIESHVLADGYIEVRFSDKGPGIPPEQLPHVFERFYQVTGVRTGVGLGLAISKEIVLAHGGTIEAKSEPGEGAEFIVRLPTVPVI
jgi:signal transduction histidine kinase